jgi:uncharacterized membrane protein YeaQ/YmgE (transglycosylase-associated protein family)
MSVLGWIVLGLIAGFIASKIVNRSGQGFLLDIALGIVGAVIGGFLFTTLAGWRGFLLRTLCGFYSYVPWQACIPGRTPHPQFARLARTGQEPFNRTSLPRTWQT